MNKKLKCLLSAVLALIMLLSMALTIPATAAQSSDDTAAASEPEETTQPAEELLTESDSDVFTDGRAELTDATEEAVETDPQSEETIPETQAETKAAVPARNTTEIAETGVAPNLNVDINVHRDKAYSNRIVLKWKSVKNAAGYRVFWCDRTKANAQKKLLSTVNKNSLTINNLKPGSKYRFSVVPYAKDGAKTVYGKTSNVIVATCPNAVTSFTIKASSSTATSMKWKRVSNIDGYIVMRQFQGKWSTYKYLKNTAVTFTDRSVKAGNAYYYKIFPYRRDTKGYVKSTSSPILRTVCGLTAPANNGTTSRGNKGYFAWKASPYATGYQLSYSTNNKNFKLIGNTTKTSYTTGKLKVGTNVYLRVRPYRLVGNAKTQVLGITKTLHTKIVADRFGVGSTYIEIDISDQHLWYYVNNEVYVSTPVVTGNYNSTDTPTGTYYINNKARDVSLVGADYVSFVEYWLCFIGSSYGIHDASWRSSFGGDIFKGNGSHGCVNTPYDAVKKIYNHVSVGTAVVIHW